MESTRQVILFFALALSCVALLTFAPNTGFALNDTLSESRGSEPSFNENHVMMHILEAAKKGLGEKAKDLLVHLENAYLAVDSETGDLVVPGVWEVRLDFTDPETDKEKSIRFNRHYMKHVDYDGKIMTVKFESAVNGHYSAEYIKVDTHENRFLSVRKVFAEKFETDSLGIVRLEGEWDYINFEDIEVSKNQINHKQGIQLAVIPGNLFDWLLNAFATTNIHSTKGDALDGLFIEKIVPEDGGIIIDENGESRLSANTYRIHYRTRKPNPNRPSSTVKTEYVVKYDRFKTKITVKGNVATIKAAEDVRKLMEKHWVFEARINILTGQVLKYKDFADNVFSVRKNNKKCNKLLKPK